MPLVCQICGKALAVWGMLNTNVEEVDFTTLTNTSSRRLWNALNRKQKIFTALKKGEAELVIQVVPIDKRVGSDILICDDCLMKEHLIYQLKGIKSSIQYKDGWTKVDKPED
jgi:hypothetical protein